MQNASVRMEKLSDISRKLTVEVPASVVTERIQKGFAEAQKTASVKGFRPGHVPMTMVRQMYAGQIEHHVFHELIDEYYQKAVVDEKIRTVGRPKIETPDHKTGDHDHAHGIHEGQALKFTATVEILPTVAVGKYKGLALKKQSVAFTQDEVEKVIQNIADSRAELTPVSGGLVGADGASMGRPAKMGDFADVDFDGGLVTETGIERQDGMKGSQMIEIGSGSFIPGFEEQLVGVRPGEEKTFQIGFPEDYFAKEMAGKKAEFTVKVKELKEKKLPAIDESFAKEMGYESLAEMREKAEAHLKRERNEESELKLRGDLLESLIKAHSFEVPKSLIQEQTRTLAQNFAARLKEDGLPEASIQEVLNGRIAELAAKAESQVRASLILDAVAEAEKIDVSMAEIETEMSSMAASMRTDIARIKEFYEKNPAKRADFEFRIREDKTVRFLLENAKVSEE